MKKLAIAGASVALAAMPIVGVFAVSQPSTKVTDVLSLTIDPGCTMTREHAASETGYENTGYTQTGDGQNTPYEISNNIAFGNMAPGTSKEMSGQAVTITCNGASANDGTWLLKAASEKDNGTAATLETTGGEEIVTGTTLDGTAAAWAFKIANNTASDNASNFVTTYGGNNWYAVPKTATPEASKTTIATMTYATESGSTPINEPGVYIFTPSYKVSIDKDQAAGTYTGAVIYTIVANPGA